MAIDLHETEVRPSVVVYTAGGDGMATAYGANAVALIGADAVLVVDPLISPALGRQIAEAVRERTAAPVRFVAFTHHHTDHTWGAAAFPGAAVLAHRACRERMAEEHPALLSSRRADPTLAPLFADASPVLPQVVYDEGLVVHLGGLEVELWHPGWGHTPGDTFLFLPDERVAICGDLVFAGYHVNYEHASLPGLRQGLRALAALDADVFIPGHGAPGGAELLDAQARYHDEVERVVREGVAEGLDDDALVERIAGRFPDHRLRMVLPTTVRRLREHVQPAR
ncbi:MAG: MBL fold metallo-hydrolase [Armatimonadota bacterium]|nr:MBL fold metallo-hydrolase [Armatimonadota bacterium]MDR7437757.1 MBL fold metallo-hydrolase [Armatimonadota bacterium]MDR7473280.1 MBL fold metallo-hydrolase [Armatimonadota bacterium]MDR7506511.1 MBL fold metallo-hydrolase [Armatimonadota bacterium]MDR7510206.1 MBL fold metallo-hydrolase [Armatimonadota bacterium]